MSRYVSIDFLPPALPENNSVATSPAVIEDGAIEVTILGIPNGLRNASTGRVFIKRIDALCVGSGASGARALVLKDQVAGNVLVNLPVHSPVPGALRTWEFPVPYMAGNDFALGSPTGSGTWHVIANGFGL